jgi:cation transporter-like permease
MMGVSSPQGAVLNAPPTQQTTVRILLAAIALLIGVIAALVAGMLQQAAHSGMPQTIEYSFGAFVATVVFVFTVISFIGGRKK